jgi:serine/threonine protein kinase
VPAPESIARFRIERQLGAGAMGVVYAAFDPDLERHVAVKVLRAAPGAVARNRLLREARAMARLSHPNVVTVHEVGTSGERDYVATELIIGSNLSEWLRAAPRSKREIVDAFLAAGRGLVAAHEAGLVHRDFKPHNVLRSDQGRIAVTDFGLARASHGEEIAERLPVLGHPDPGSLESELTRSGGLVGTPGYMAPEQWEGLEVDAAADQFSFCVALWEAVAGQRPFLGDTVEELRAQVQRPPLLTDAAEKIPRALRHILMRGLAQRPGERYPTMRALIESIEIARRRPRRIAAVAVVVAILGGVVGSVIYAGHSSALPDSNCPPPIMTAESVWSPQKRALMPERVAQQFDRKISEWRTSRDLACHSDSEELRRVRAACLDAVISTIDLTVKAMSTVDEATRRASDVTDLAGWSAACMQPTVPTLRKLSSELSLPAASLLLKTLTRTQVSDGELAKAYAAAQNEPCDRAFALYVNAVARISKASFGRETALAEDAIESCGDDYLRARVSVLRALRTETPFYGPEQLALLRKATAAVARVADTSMLSHIELIRGRAAYINSAFDTAIEHFDRSRKFAEKGDDSRAVFEAQWLAISARSDRGRAGDLNDLVATGRALYEQMVQAYGASSANLWPYRQALAGLEWRAGDLDRSRQFLGEALREPSRVNHAPTRAVRGKIVDDRGRPLEGMLVLAIAAEKTADVDGVDLALWNRDTLEDVSRAISSADGSFELRAATGDIFLLARSAGLAAPVTKVSKTTNELVLRALPTGTVHGAIEYAGNSQYSTRASVGAGRKGFHFIAPIAEDGRYEVGNVPPGTYEVRTLTGKVSEISMTGQRIKIEPGRRKAPVNFGQSQGDSKVHVIVRNERAGVLDVAQIYVLRGRVTATTMRELRPALDASASTSVALARPVMGERSPKPALGHLRPGDLLASIEHLEPGLQSLCAVGLSGDLGAEDFVEKLQDSADKLDVRCKSLVLSKTGEEVVQISVPPMLRLD